MTNGSGADWRRVRATESSGNRHHPLSSFCCLQRSRFAIISQATCTLLKNSRGIREPMPCLTRVCTVDVNRDRPEAQLQGHHSCGARASEGVQDNCIVITRDAQYEPHQFRRESGSMLSAIRQRSDTPYRTAVSTQWVVVDAEVSVGVPSEHPWLLRLGFCERPGHTLPDRVLVEEIDLCFANI